MEYPILKRGDGSTRKNFHYQSYVVQIQRGLNALGYDLIDDGWLGPRTEEAIKDFKHKEQVMERGYGILTWKAIRQICVERAQSIHRKQGGVII
jgi:peptidoglycan hydrolase-like protein with peptidoglycan-binding domain